MSIPPSAAPRIGVISDTHGFLDSAVLDIFAGVDLIIHAGDVQEAGILTVLAEVAPVVAVSGNIDGAELAATLPRELTGTCGGIRFVVCHKRKRVLKRLAAGRYADAEGRPPDVVIFGHEHVPSAAWVDGSLLLNPGTASSPHEEDDGPTVAVLDATAAGLAVRFVPLPRRPVEDAEAD